MTRAGQAPTKKLVTIVNSGGMMRDAGVQDVAWDAARVAGERLGYTIETIGCPLGRNSDPLPTIQNADVVLADVSRRDPDALNAVGIADGLSKPIIVLATDPGEVPLLHRNKRVFIWTGSTLNLPSPSVMAQIADALVSTLQSSSVGPVAKRTKLFLSYAHADKMFLDRLLVHMRPLESAGLVDFWSDKKIRPGDQWRSAIRIALEGARVAVLLVSADFIASEFIQTNELPSLLRSAETDGTRIVPIILKPCRFKREPGLSQFQALNDPSEPVIRMSEADREGLYDRLAEMIELEIAQFAEPRKPR